MHKMGFVPNNTRPNYTRRTNALPDKVGGCCRLAPHTEGFAAVADEAGLLRYVTLHNTTFSTDSVYQLQYGSELVYQNCEPLEVPHMVNRPWTAFEFIPHKTRTILFHQSGSNKLLYATLPDATSPSSPVLLFGSHTGHFPCSLTPKQHHTSLGKHLQP